MTEKRSYWEDLYLLWKARKERKVEKLIKDDADTWGFEPKKPSFHFRLPNLSMIIAAIIPIMIGMSLIPMITEEVENAVNATGLNASNAIPLAETMTWGTAVLKLVPGFFAFGLLAAGIAIAFNALMRTRREEELF